MRILHSGQKPLDASLSTSSSVWQKNSSTKIKVSECGIGVITKDWWTNYIGYTSRSDITQFQTQQTMILQYQQLTGQRRTSVDCFGSKGMRREGKQIHTNRQRIGWQDAHGKKNSVKYGIKQTHQGLGTLVAFK